MDLHCHDADLGAHVDLIAVAHRRGRELADDPHDLLAEVRDQMGFELEVGVVDDGVDSSRPAPLGPEAPDFGERFIDASLRIEGNVLEADFQNVLSGAVRQFQA